MQAGSSADRRSTRAWFWIITVCLAVGLPLGVAEMGLRLYGLTDPLIYRTDDCFGYEPAPDQTIRRRNIVQVIDEEGFRSSSRVSDRDRKRVVFIGDSVTYGGTYIRTEDTFVEIVGQRLAGYGYTAKNAGVNSYSVAQMANRYMHSLESESDEIVVVYFIEGNWHRPPLKQPLPGGPFHLKKPRVALFEGMKYFSLVRLDVVSMGGFVIPASVTGTTELVGRVADITMDHFLDRNMEAAVELIKFCRDRSRKIVFVHSPGRSLRQLEPTISGFLKDQGVDFVDLAPEFDSGFSEDLYVDIAHYSEKGHRFASERLAELLIPMIEQRVEEEQASEVSTAHEAGTRRCADEIAGLSL